MLKKQATLTLFVLMWLMCLNTNAFSQSNTGNSLKEARHIQNYLEQVLGPGVQVNISAQNKPTQLQRKQEKSNPQIQSKQETSQTINTTGNNGSQTTQNSTTATNYTYDATETLTQITPKRSGRSITVVYATNNQRSAQETETLIRNVLSATPQDKVVIQAYTPPAARTFPKLKKNGLWQLILISGSIGLLLGIGLMLLFYRRRQKAPHVNAMPYNGIILPEENPYASELQ